MSSLFHISPDAAASRRQEYLDQAKAELKALVKKSEGNVPEKGGSVEGDVPEKGGFVNTAGSMDDKPEDVEPDSKRLKTSLSDVVQRMLL